MEDFTTGTDASIVWGAWGTGIESNLQHHPWVKEIAGNQYFTEKQPKPHRNVYMDV